MLQRRIETDEPYKKILSCVYNNACPQNWFNFDCLPIEFIFGSQNNKNILYIEGKQQKKMKYDKKNSFRFSLHFFILNTVQKNINKYMNVS